MKIRIAIAASAVILIVTMIAAAAALRADEQGKKPLTPEMAITLRSESDLRFSADGKHLAFVVSEPPHGTERARHIWAMDTLTRHIRQYTYSKKSEYSPRWAPDGSGLAFLSNRDEQAQIYFLPADGGEAYALTEGKRGIRSFEWSPDASQIAFLAPDPKTDADEKKEKDKDDARVVDKDDKPAGLWLLDVATHKARRITTAPWEINSIAWLPDGKAMIVSATDHPESDEETNRIFSVSAADGKMTLLYAPKGPFGDIKISPDGKWMAYNGARVDGPDAPDLYLLSTSGGTPKNLTAESLDRSVEGFVWRQDGSIVADVEDGFKTKLYSVTTDGKAKAAEALPSNPRSFDISSNGDLAFAGGTATMPEEVWFAKGFSSPAMVSHMNKSWDSVELMQPEYFKYKSFDGTEIEAALLTPPEYDGHSKLPLIALIHGGPTGAWPDSIQTWGQMLAARGYAIFYPNVRGSTGYGEKFTEMNRADWGGADFKDVMAGVDALIARGVADPDKLGIGGWSYGGYMSEWAITQTTRFKAAVSGAGMFDLIAEFGTERGPAYDEWFFGQPYEKPEGFLKSSPFMYAKNAKTPTLILQGENDTTDPIGQSEALYRALKHYGVKAELVTYPREPHGLGEEKHQLDMLRRILEWYDENLKGAAPKPAAATAASAGAGGPEQYGKVDFPTSCNAAAQKSMTTGVAQLHSFQYQQAEGTFGQAAKQDSNCAIAYWGEAMSLYYQLWEFPTPETLAEGRKDVEKAQSTGAPTSREKEYIAAAAAFFQDDAKLTHMQRREAYSKAMAKQHEDNPQDVEGAAFYALSLVAMADYGPSGTAMRRQAIAILQPLFAKYPDDPGLAHYLIHAADTPDLAPEGLEAAREYARIAPDSSHAIHMPSHIFRRLGLWQESIASNIAASASAAHATEMNMADAGYQTHAMDFLNYSYLQSGQEAKARKVVEDLKSVPGASAGEMADMQAIFEARDAVESHDWKEAAALAVPNEKPSWLDATYLARTIGAARRGDTEGARENEKNLEKSIEARDKEAKGRGETVREGKGVEQREGEAWVAFAEGKSADALDEMRSAAEREEAAGSDPDLPPAREMLADMQLELKRPAEALVSYEAALKVWPNRFDSVLGAARAAEAAGNAKESREYFAKLIEISGPGADRPELQEARMHEAAKE
jgi:dipeptidyl aminopeptidase/acylaminoacyl peptidase